MDGTTNVDVDYDMRAKLIREYGLADWLVQSPEWDDIQAGQQEAQRRGRLAQKALDHLRTTNIRANQSLSKLALSLAAHSLNEPSPFASAADIRDSQYCNPRAAATAEEMSFADTLWGRYE